MRLLGQACITSSRRRPSTCPHGTAGGIVTHRLKRSLHKDQTEFSPEHLNRQRLTAKQYYDVWKNALQNRSVDGRNFKIEPHFPSETNPFVPPPSFPALWGPGESCILAALERNDTDMAMRAMLHGGPKESRVVATLDQSAFHELLRLVDPETVTKPLQRLLHSCPARFHTRSYVQFIENIYKQYEIAMSNWTRIRSEAKHKTTFFEMKFLLKCASVNGNLVQGKRIWGRLKILDYKPDAECYTYYLGCHVNGEAFGTRKRMKLAVTPRMLAEKLGRGRGFATDSVGGIRDLTLNILETAQAEGLDFSEEIYVNMLLGFSRIGDQAAMNAILRDAWNIDAEAVMKDSGSMAPIAIPSKKSSLYPTTSLLSAIAQGYGACNNVPGAIRLVDYVSRAFKINIDMETWEKLIQYCYKFSENLTPRHVDGVISPNMTNVIHLWKVMTSPPYNVHPSMFIRHIYFKALLKLGARDEARKVLESGRRDFLETWEEVLARKEQFMFAYNNYPRNTSIPKLLPSLEQLRNRLFLAQLKCRHIRLSLYGQLNHLVYGLKLVKLVGPDKSVVKMQQTFENAKRLNRGWNKRSFDFKMRNIPNMIEYWWEYLPYFIWYTTPTGAVVLEVENERTTKKRGRPRPRSMAYLRRKTPKESARSSSQTADFAESEMDFESAEDLVMDSDFEDADQAKY